MATARSLTGLDDILYHILSHLAPGLKAPGISFGKSVESRSNRKALACLARTHSSFTRPALAEMWRSLPSQGPLEHLLCVVGIAQGHPLGESDGPVLELCGTPTTHKEGYVRFREYALLVREIIIDPYGLSWDIHAGPLEGAFWCQFIATLGDTPILPRLERVTICSMISLRSVDMGVLRLLNSCPCIRELNVALRLARGTDLKRFGNDLRVLSSWIQRLEVLMVEGQDLTLFLDAETLPNLHPHLRSLELRLSDPVNLDQLLPLAPLSKLECLSISPLTWGSKTPILPTKFPALRSLTVFCSQSAFIGTDSLLDHIYAPQLQSFSVKEAYEDFDDLIQVFSSHLRTLVAKCPSLTTFKWHSQQSWTRRMDLVRQRPSSAPLAEFLAPLLSCRAIRHFSVSFRGPIVPYAPADLHAIAGAWPDLQTFCLDVAGDGNRRRADLESIVAFARRCPGLRNLRLPMVLFDRTSALADELAHGALAPHWLREFSVDHVRPSGGQDAGDRYREDAVQFLALMQRLFPLATMPRLG